MTWQLASVVVLFVALSAGFGWYERSKPPARVLALVAALAALAALGRVIFAAFPNVKPTTDIVLFSGMALGGPAGFAVGALAALVSNVFLGQGPWTPWQMAAWGVIGLGGSAIGKLMRGREPNRLMLALVCGLAGFAFGAIMDTYQWTLAAEHNAASWIAISGTSFGFNVAHAVGNVVFALLIGPAFVRSIARYRRRFDVRWLDTAPAFACALMALVVATALHAPPRADAAKPSADVAPAVANALRYMRAAQNADGGFGASPKQGSSSLHTGWAALGLASAGRNPQDLERRSRSSIDFLRAHVRDISDTGELERTILVLHAAGLPPKLEGSNLLARLLKRRRADGSFDGLVNATAFGVLALRAAGRPTRSTEVRRAAAWLLKSQNDDGGFGFTRKSASDVDDTGAVLQALGAAGRRGAPVVDRAVRFLRRAQRPDGGFAQRAAGPSNAQSTAWAVQGLVAAGRDPRALKRSGRSPIRYLVSLQSADGSIRYSRTSAQTPVWVTSQALTALETKAYPLPPAPRHKAVTAAASSGTAKAAPAPKPKKRARKRRRPRAHAAIGAETDPAESPMGESASEFEPASGEQPLSTGPGTITLYRTDRDADSGSPAAAAIAAAAALLALLGLRRLPLP